MNRNFFALNSLPLPEGAESNYWHTLARLYNTQEVLTILDKDTWNSPWRHDWYENDLLDWQQGADSNGEPTHPAWVAYREFNQMCDRANKHRYERQRRLQTMKEALYARMNAGNQESRYGVNRNMHLYLRKLNRTNGYKMAKAIAEARKKGADPWVAVLNFQESLLPGSGYLHIQTQNAGLVMSYLNPEATAKWFENAGRLSCGEWKHQPNHWLQALNAHHEVTPGANPDRYLHQVHVSTDDPSMLAYTQSVDKLVRGIQTKIKPGRYLAKFYPEMPERDRATLAETWDQSNNKRFELKFIESDDPDGWVRVYENGPSSCMRGSESVRVYAYPDNGLRLAYWEDRYTGEIVARAVVREDENLSRPKQYVRVYPNCDTSELTDRHNAFKQLLVDNGYVHGNLNGVALQRIIRHNDFVMPYLDYGNGGVQEATDCGDYIRVEVDGELDCTNTNGYATDRGGYTCEECGDRVHEDDTTYVESEEIRVCQHCLDNEFTYAYGRRYQDWFRNDDVIRCESDGEYYVEEYAANHDVYQCADSGYWYHIDDLVSCDVGRYAGEMIHCDAAERDGITDEVAHSDEFTDDDNGVKTFDEYLVRDDATGEEYHEQTVVKITVGRGAGRRVLHIHPDNLTAEYLVKTFVRCGDLLLTKAYYGHALTRENLPEYWEPSNVEYPDHGNYEEISDLLVDYFDEHDEDDDILRQLELARPNQVVEFSIAA